MNLKTIKLISLICISLFLFSACAKDTDTKKTDAPKQNIEVQNDNSTSSTSASDGSKYADAEVYEKKGVPHAKTDDGQEVEITGESLQSLIGEYEKVKGTGSDKEKDLLNKIQLILEAPKE